MSCKLGTVSYELRVLSCELLVVNYVLLLLTPNS